MQSSSINKVYYSYENCLEDCRVLIPKIKEAKNWIEFFWEVDLVEKK